jgi:hypothetical protein
MYDDDQQRRCEILAQARAFLERVKDLAERRDDTLPLPSPPDRVAEWRAAADLRAAAKTELAANKQFALATRTDTTWLEQRLEQERELTFDVIGEIVAKLRAEQRDDNRTEFAGEVAKLWTAVVETKKAIVEIQRDRVDRAFRNGVADWAKVKMN